MVARREHAGERARVRAGGLEVESPPPEHRLQCEHELGPQERLTAGHADRARAAGLDLRDPAGRLERRRPRVLTPRARRRRDARGGSSASAHEAGVSHHRQRNGQPRRRRKTCGSPTNAASPWIDANTSSTGAHGLVSGVEVPIDARSPRAGARATARITSWRRAWRPRPASRPRRAPRRHRLRPGLFGLRGLLRAGDLEARADLREAPDAAFLFLELAVLLEDGEALDAREHAAFTDQGVRAAEAGVDRHGGTLRNDRQSETRRQRRFRTSSMRTT